MVLSFFAKNCRGGVAPLVGLAGVPLVALVGAAVDYSRANAARTAMQSALDASALMLAKDSQGQGLSDEQATATATSYFKANFTRPEVPTTTVAASLSQVPGGKSLSLSANGVINTTFMGVIGISTIPLSVTSNAIAQADGLGCVLALDRTASGAATGQGSNTVNLNSCSLYDNSNSASALTIGGSAQLSALSVGVVGGISGSQSIATTQGIIVGVGPVTDPYTNDSYPNFSSCTIQNYTGKSTETVGPGVYCGGMKFNSGANVALNPGIYYLDGGSFSVDGGATVSGSGVTLVFTKKNSSSWATATINGNAIVNLSPPTSGPTAGIVVFGDRSIPLGTTFKFNGGSSQYLAGAIYVPTGAIQFSGGMSGNNTCTQIIGDTVTFTGNSSVAISCSAYNTKPFSSLIIRVAS